MISVFKYTFSKENIDEILNNNTNKLLDIIPFTTRDGKDYELELRGKGYCVTQKGKLVGKIQYYEKDLAIPSIAKIDLGNNHQLYLHLDAISNVVNIRDYHANRLGAIRKGVSANYLKDLAVICNFNDDDEFLLFCFMYIIFRLTSEDDELDTYFTEKLSYYDYGEDDLDKEVPFNNSTNIKFLRVVDKALNILFNGFIFRKLTLKHLGLDDTDLDLFYAEYFVTAIIT